MALCTDTCDAVGLPLMMVVSTHCLIQYRLFYLTSHSAGCVTAHYVTTYNFLQKNTAVRFHEIQPGADTLMDVRIFK